MQQLKVDYRPIRLRHVKLLSIKEPYRRFLESMFLLLIDQMHYEPCIIIIIIIIVVVVVVVVIVINRDEIKLVYLRLRLISFYSAHANVNFK